MPSTYSNSLRIELIGAGEQAGTWNITTNRNLGTLIEQGIAGVDAINISTGSKELLALNGAADEARNAVLILTGTPASGVTLTVPNADKQYTVQNRTTQPVTFTTAGGTVGYTCPPQSTSNVVVHAQGVGEVTGLSITDDMAIMLASDDDADARAIIGAAPLDSPEFTGTPQAPTAPPGSNSTQIATTAFVLQNGVPSGGIMMWSGSVASIPSDWRLCNGSNGTPDLRDRFVIGAGGAYEVEDTGGSADATLVAHSHTGQTGGQSHNHTHSGSTSSAGAHTHQIYNGYFGGDSRSMASDERSYGTASVAYNTTSAGAHAHSFTTGGESATHTHSFSTSSAGGNATNANLPPYYALCFIMKV